MFGWIKNIFVIIVILSVSATCLSQEADFTANTVTGCDNLVVQFTDLSTGSPIGWLWDFGDGGATSTLQNPSHFYSGTGIFTVSLTVTYNSGEDTETKTDYISIYGSPTSDFTSDVFSGCPPLTVNFIDNSTAGDGIIVSRVWDFGDGSTSTEQDPSYTYTSQGSFNVSLYITDENGCTDEKIMADYISVLNAPSAGFSVSEDYACVPPLSVTITNNTTGTGITGYSWDFGDGSTDTSEDPPPHTYNDFGEYLITLVVYNSAGCNDTATKTVSIIEYTADFSCSVIDGCVPLTVTFEDLSTDPDTWSWDFGDGQGISSLQDPEYTYDSPGTYTVSLISGNAYGCGDTVIKQDYITVHPLPEASYSIDDSTACSVPFPVSFTDDTEDAVSWSWDFGDGNVSSLEDPVHTYNDTGIFDVTLMVTDINGCSATVTDTGIIRIIEPIAEFIDTTITGQAEPYKGCKPLTVDFTDLSFSNEEITTWSWDFGDGNTSSEQNPSHTYQDTGSYTVSLVIVNIEGCTDSITRSDIVLVGQPPVTHFSPQDTTGCHPFTVQFTDSSSTYTDEWSWSFGGSGPDVSYTYTDTGYFNVTLITAFHGCYDTLSIDSAVHVLVPKALFTADPMIGCDTPHVVTFTDDSYDPDSWEWDFGDGSPVSNDTNPMHTYTDYGSFEVWLYVENSGTGCRDSISKTIVIPDIDPGFDIDTTAGCRPLTITFTDTSSASTNITDWKWDFGDGAIIGFGSGVVDEQNTTGTYQDPVHIFDTAGIFDISFYVSENHGCTDSIKISSLIDVKELPSPSFTMDTTFGCKPLTVEFTDITSTPPEIISWLWEFGDGSTSTEQDPLYTYTEAGSYYVTLTVVDTFNCENTLNDTNEIIVTFPVPEFDFDTIICNNETVTFNNTSVGSDLTYIWDYGDGSPNDTTTQTTTTHFYSVDSDMSVYMDIVLIAIDTNGCTDSITKQLLISIPKAEFTTSATDTTCPPFIVNFTDLSIGTISSWEWNFGDSTITSNLQNPAHTYSVAGYFDVSLIAGTPYGCTDTIIKDSLIHIDGPMGSFTYEIDSSICVWEITFMASTENATTVFWVFGDGGTAFGDTVVYTYYTPGTYTPTMIIMDGEGCQVEIESGDDLVIPPIDLTVTFDITDENCTNSDGSATAVPAGGPEPYSYEWNTGATDSVITGLAAGVYYITVTDNVGCFIMDSAVINSVFPDIYISFETTDAICITDNGTAKAVIDSGGTAPYSFIWSTGETTDSISYLAAGLYYITVTDDNGCPDIDSVTINITYNDLEIGFYTTDALCLTNSGTAIAFVLSGGTPPYSYFWADSTVNDTITDLATGVYPVTITDSLGCIGTDSAVVGQSTTGITALFTMDNNNVYSYIPITFTPELLDSNIFEWIWYFGDGDTLTDTTGDPVIHLYNTSGNYSVVMHITDIYGCTDSISIPAIIKEGFDIPNVFTPNGDGMNDAFIIQGSGIDEISLTIFNRWGEVIMQRTSLSYISWDGRTNAGVEASHGTYFYIIEATFTDGRKESFHGFLTLFR